MAKTKQTPIVNQFKEAIDKTPDVNGGYQPGLQALKGSYSSYIQATDTRLIDGSLDIDEKVKNLYPKENRWDYAISYDNKVCFVEIHPAETSEVSVMIAKLKWLKNWLKEKAPDIDNLPFYSPRFIWIASGRCSILPNSRYAKQISQSGLSNPVQKFILK